MMVLMLDCDYKGRQLHWSSEETLIHEANIQVGQRESSPTALLLLLLWLISSLHILIEGWNYWENTTFILTLLNLTKTKTT